MWLWRADLTCLSTARLSDTLVAARCRRTTLLGGKAHVLLLGKCLVEDVAQHGRVVGADDAVSCRIKARRICALHTWLVTSQTWATAALTHFTPRSYHAASMRVRLVITIMTTNSTIQMKTQPSWSHSAIHIYTKRPSHISLDNGAKDVWAAASSTWRAEQLGEVSHQSFNSHYATAHQC